MKDEFSLELRREKSILRREIRRRLLEISESDRLQWSAGIAATIFERENWRRADLILVFVSMDHEVLTNELIERALLEKKTVGVPRIHGNEIKFHVIQGLDGPWDLHAYGLKEPQSDLPVIDPASMRAWVDTDSGGCLILTPGLAFDEGCGRLGHGRGYYDGFLSACGIPAGPKDKRSFDGPRYQTSLVPETTGLGFEVQIVDEVPVGPHDVLLHSVVTENRVL